jgi:polysaccharide pyruvyl transferase WcaK-like protein
LSVENPHRIPEKVLNDSETQGKEERLKGGKKKRKKISFFGNFGQGNLGNESTLQAILYYLRQHLPDAEVNCICTGADDTATIHKIAAFPMKDVFVKPGPLSNHPLVRPLRRISIGLAGELYRWLKAFKTLHGTDMLIVPGTQFLSDNLCGPLDWPYMTFKWSVASKIMGCKLLFVSVGVGPLRHPLSRFFVKSALSLADYRSYRDTSSKQYICSIGFDPTNDPVYPDLAFSLPTPKIRLGNPSNRGKPVVALGVKDYHGQYGPWPLHHRPEVVYRHYIDRTADFVAWLLEQQYIVRLVIGDVSYDTEVLKDLRKSLNDRTANFENLHVIDEPIESVEGLLAQLATSDIVVSPRFHNVVLGLLLNRPVIAIAYHEKFSALMEGTDLGNYNLHIDDFDTRTLIETFIELDKNSDRLKLQINRKVEEYCTALGEQYELIFKYI